MVATMTENRILCPACGGDLGYPEGSDPYACPRCRFPYAQVSLFASESGVSAWTHMAQKHRSELVRKLQKTCRENGVFRLAGGAVAVRLPEDGTVTLVNPAGLLPLNDPPVIQYGTAGIAERNVVRLLADGTVRVTGDNSYGQCNTEDMTGIRRVLATPNCTYGITETGEVVCCGQPMSPDVDQWRNIRDLVAGAYHLAGLTSDGRVLLAGEMLNRNVTREVSAWRNVSAIAAAGDATLALTAKGTQIVFAGKLDDSRREAITAWKPQKSPRNEHSRSMQWTKITDISLESVYAVALTLEGRVLLAGKNRNEYLDMGRKDAANWKDIIAISCSRSGIGALGVDGTLYLAGNLRDIDQIQDAWKGIRPHLMDQLLRSIQDTDPGTERALSEL